MRQSLRVLLGVAVIATGLLAAAPVATAAAAPTVGGVELPGNGPGDLLRATGTGFGPGVSVDVSLVAPTVAPIPVTTVTADPSGTVVLPAGTYIPFTVTPGTYQLAMTQPDGVAARSSDLLTVSEPDVRFPASLLPGQPSDPVGGGPTFFVSGLSDFPDTTRTVTIDGRTTDVQWFHDAREFAAPGTGVSAPSDLTVGPHEVTFTQTGRTPYTVTATVRVDPPSAQAAPRTGTRPVLPLRLAPTAWNDDFDVTIVGAAGDRHTGMRWTRTRPENGSGTTSTTVTPGGALSVGTATLTAVSRANGATAVTTFEVDPAVVTSPAGLTAGGRVVSATGTRELDMQDDGNLVERDPTTGLTYWTSNTPLHPGARLTVQSDGNAVIRGTDGRALWSTGTAGIGAGARFGLSATDAITVVTAGGRTAWSAFWPRDDRFVVGTLPATHYLFKGQQLALAEGAPYPYAVSVGVQLDGDVVFSAYRRSTVWSTHTAGHPNDYLVLQSDGNLVVRAANGAALWANGVRGVAGARLVVQNDGNLVEYASTNRAVWSTRTHVDL